MRARGWAITRNVTGVLAGLLLAGASVSTVYYLDLTDNVECADAAACGVAVAATGLVALVLLALAVGLAAMGAILAAVAILAHARSRRLEADQAAVT